MEDNDAMEPQEWNDVIFWENPFEIVGRKSKRFSLLPLSCPMPDHALEFMAERKGVGSWAGPETGLEIGSVVPPHQGRAQESALPTVLRGARGIPDVDSHGFWSILKRLCHYWLGRRAARCRAKTHFFFLSLSLCKWRILGMWTPVPYCPCPSSTLFTLRLQYLQRSWQEMTISYPTESDTLYLKTLLLPERVSSFTQVNHNTCWVTSSRTLLSPSISMADPIQQPLQLLLSTDLFSSAYGHVQISDNLRNVLWCFLHYLQSYFYFFPMLHFLNHWSIQAVPSFRKISILPYLMLYENLTPKDHQSVNLKING